MSHKSRNLGTAPTRRIPLIPIYAFGFLSALAVSFGLRFEHSGRGAMLVAGFLFAAIALAWFARFLVAADELFKTINYWALVFGFVSFLALTLVFEFLKAFVEEAKRSGIVASFIEREGVVGRLSVAPPG